MTLKQRLISYFKRQYIENKTLYVASGDIQRLVSEKTSYTPSNVSRRLREMENNGTLEVKYERNHAYYKLSDGYWNKPPQQLSLV